MMNGVRRIWQSIRGLVVPILLWALLAAIVVEPIQSWLEGNDRYDEAAVREWIEETRVFRETLGEMCRELRRRLIKAGNANLADEASLSIEAEKIFYHLNSLGGLTKMYPAQLPLFLVVYRLAVTVEGAPGTKPTTIIWDSGLPRQEGQYRELAYDLEEGSRLQVLYQAHAFHKKAQDEQALAQRFRLVLFLALAGTSLSLLWIYLVQRRERERQQQRILARQQLDMLENRRLEEELRRRQVEQQHEEVGRKLLEQRLATQAAEQKALELRSQLYAGIGIMAGSYAHNIKNLLVRPNDLLRRCLENHSLGPDQEHMLNEVRLTLGTVTERLQQILRTVRRDPSRAERRRLDLNEVVRELHVTWEELAREKWKLNLTLGLCPGKLEVEGDLSHLQQAIENLIFNARDATFEMRNHRRDEARRRLDIEHDARKQAILDAVGWRGEVALRTLRDDGRAILEVRDNGIGMSEDVRLRCTETHFTTKRDNALYEGNSTGMGLGLSFVAIILEHHQGSLEIESTPGQGATVRAIFPLAITTVTEAAADLPKPPPPPVPEAGPAVPSAPRNP